MTLDDHPITDTKLYNDRMALSLIDKIFFIDKIDAELIVDYGCADGALMAAVHKLFPDQELMGYDVSIAMVLEASANNPTLSFTDRWKDVQAVLDTTTGKKALLLSSLIHEVYNYCNPTEIKEFWDRVWNSGFDYVIIRDMMVSHTTSRPSDPISVARIRQLADPVQIFEWEAQWGSINENWSLVHYLLTYSYTENWKRELKENYLPLNVERFLNMIPKEYSPSFIEHYTLPFIRNQVAEDFGVQLQDRTHLKLILTKTG